MIVTVADVAPVTAAVGAPGCPGGARGVMEVDTDDALEVPAVLVAVAENVYAVPLVRLLKEQLPEAPVTVQVVGDDDGNGDGVTV